MDSLGPSVGIGGTGVQSRRVLALLVGNGRLVCFKIVSNSLPDIIQQSSAKFHLTMTPQLR